jgi:hypothetical protein
MPVVVYVGILLVSALYLLPEYRQLRTLAARDGISGTDLEARLMTVTWIGRVQILAAVLALWNVLLRLEL